MSNASAHDLVDFDHPWPGLEAFTEAAQGFFHGRDEEIAELLRRTKAQPLTVLFGQSGLGKTSLLRAGLFPRLRSDGFLPIYIRLTFASTAPPLWDQVYARVADAIAEAKLDATYPLDGETSLWGWLHARNGDLCDLRGRELTPVLVLDQFEELFTLGRTKTSAFTDPFVAALGDVVENRLPSELERLLEAEPERAREFDFGRRSYRVLLSLREDFLPDLEDLRATIPSLIENRMRLTRMTGIQALDAVLRPGGALLTQDVGEAIVRFVAGGASNSLARLEVEPSLLSLVCRELNEQRRSASVPQITTSMLAGSRDAILSRFYDACLAPHPPAVRAFVEDELVTDSGYRETMALERARKNLERRAAPPEALDQLVQSRLLRVEQRLGVARIELAHDILAPVVCESRSKRQAREEKEDLARRHREIEAQAERSRRELRAARRRALVLGVLFLAATSAAVLALRATREAAVQRARADQQRLVTEASLRRFYDAQAERALTAWEEGNVRRAREVLSDTISADAATSATPDLRGWEWYYVDGLCQLSDVGNRVIPTGKDEITAIAFVPLHGPSVVAVATTDGTVALWDVASGKEIARWRWGSEGDFPALAASPDGRFLAFGGIDGKIVLWDAATGEVVSEVDADGFVTGLAVTATGNDLLFSTLDHPDVVRISSGGSGSRRRFYTHERNVSAFTLSPDGSRLAVVTVSGKATIWDLAGEQPTLTVELSDPDRTVSSVAFSPDGRLLGALVSGFVQLFDVATTTKRPLSGEQTYATSFAFDRTGRHMATAGEDGAVYVWDAAEGKQQRVFRGHLAPAFAVGFAPDGKTLVSGGTDSALRVWDLVRPSVERFREFGVGIRSVTSLALSPDGRYLLTATPLAKPPEVRIYDAATARLLSQIPGKVFRVEFDPKGSMLAVPSAEEGLNLVAVPSGKTVRTLPGPRLDARVVAFSPDGRHIVVVPDDRDVPIGGLLVDVDSGATRALPDTDWSEAAAFSPDGSLLAVASLVSRQIVLFRVATGERVTAIATPLAKVLRFSPDGSLLLSAGDVGTIALWNVGDGTLAGELKGHTSSVLDAVFAPNGGRLVSASNDRTIRLWNVSARRELFVLDDTIKTRALAFAPDGLRLVSGGWNHVRFWDAAILSRHAENSTVVSSSARASYLFQLGQWEAAIAALSHALSTGPPDGALLEMRADAFAELGQWEKAAADFERATMLADENKANYGLALVSLRLGRRAVYESARSALVDVARTGMDAHAINSAVWLTALSPEGAGPLTEEIALQREATKKEPKDYAIASTLGTILARGGDPDEAVRVLEEAMTLAHDHETGTALDWVSLALAHARAGRMTEARRWLEKTDRQRERLTSDPLYEDPNWSWDTWRDMFELDLLQHDAASLIEAAGPSPASHRGAP